MPQPLKLLQEMKPYIDPIKIATVLLREKKTILQIMLVVVLFTAFVVYGLVKPWFTAQATFFVKTDRQCTVSARKSIRSIRCSRSAWRPKESG